MSFADLLARYREFGFTGAFASITPRDVEQSLAVERKDVSALLSLLSPAAEGFLEAMARQAHETTLRHFGRTIQLYTPIYVSNYCDNTCTYCGFNARNRIERRRLGPEEVDREAAYLSSTGIRHILLLTGDSRKKSPVSYLCDCVEILKQYFSAIAVEVYPLTGEEYRELVSAGVDGLTIYQETYDEARYAAIHPIGPKKDFHFRLRAPDRGAQAGMKQISIGALLGLADWRREAFLLGMHARYLQDRYPEVEIGVSLPRLRPHAGQAGTKVNVMDRNIVQIILALRLLLPRLGIAISTRETARFRENLIPLGVTRMSAGSSTRVGGHTTGKSGGILPDQDEPQFAIADNRGVPEIAAMIRQKGYDPVFKDWTML
jgi:2-iminoacetate synthase